MLQVLCSKNPASSFESVVNKYCVKFRTYIVEYVVEEVKMIISDKFHFFLFNVVNCNGSNCFCCWIRELLCYLTCSRTTLGTKFNDLWLWLMQRPISSRWWWKELMGCVFLQGMEILAWFLWYQLGCLGFSHICGSNKVRD